jgi:hypothetical protein
MGLLGSDDPEPLLHPAMASRPNVTASAPALRKRLITDTFVVAKR